MTSRTRQGVFPLCASFCAAVAIIVLLIVNPGATPVYATDMFGELREPGEPFFMAGHRGDRSVAPENTLTALQHAIDSPLDFVETDISRSSDGVPVLFHDRTLKRTTDGVGPLADKTLAELQSLDAGSWYSAAFAGERIPTLAEFLAILAPSDKKALLELKGYWSIDELAVVTTLIDDAGVSNRVIFMSFNLGSLSSAAALAPAIPRLAILRALPDDPVTYARSFGVIGVVTASKLLAARPTLIDDMHVAGLGVLLYTLNSEETWEHARSLGVDGIITDRPSNLDAWLASTAPGT
ncbi:glycerophosphoryl diester phosphodiesterase [Okibacterium sp. HSC-33S16]|uniref:glycerophosphodiester phosphodiesterase n=1 Tax=Okibacterium sp. HSC-33S16 TaxID=2910965 RepID=UPI0020A0CF87|nr:glycerophosphodiester phosphodiesterase family protein [Okibacterium sp. HSC-33S16]MCP2031867.1 glycerophosphoryl diester phosphodiesterase [Okibacterium sp. HSC-33S16]